MHRKNRKTNGGSSNSLNQHLVCNNDSNRSNPSTSKGVVDSPFKKFLSNMKSNRVKVDSDDDFQTPVKISSKTLKQTKLKKNKNTKKNPSISNFILKRTKDNFKNLDVNPEHLQMGLALSKSTYAEENPKEDDEEPDLPLFLSPQNIPKVTTLLEKYGFKSSKQKLRPRDNLEESRKNKSSKFRFVTPVLYIRKNDERQTIINNKVSLILNQNQSQQIFLNTSKDNLNSTTLESYFGNKKCWTANNLSENCYFCESLQISFEKSVVGCLLKDWSEIPGREQSPERFPHEITIKHEDVEMVEGIETVDISCEQSSEKVCGSPDLFSSEDESVENMEIFTGFSNFESIASPKSIFSKKLDLKSVDSDGNESVQEVLQKNDKLSKKCGPKSYSFDVNESGHEFELKNNEFSKGFSPKSYNCDEDECVHEFGPKSDEFSKEFGPKSYSFDEDESLHEFGPKNDEFSKGFGPKSYNCDGDESVHEFGPKNDEFSKEFGPKSYNFDEDESVHEIGPKNDDFSKKFGPKSYDFDEDESVHEFGPKNDEFSKEFGPKSYSFDEDGSVHEVGPKNDEFSKEFDPKSYNCDGDESVHEFGPKTDEFSKGLGPQSYNCDGDESVHGFGPKNDEFSKGFGPKSYSFEEDESVLEVWPKNDEFSHKSFDSRDSENVQVILQENDECSKRFGLEPYDVDRNESMHEVWQENDEFANELDAQTFEPDKNERSQETEEDSPTCLPNKENISKQVAEMPETIDLTQNSDDSTETTTKITNQDQNNEQKIVETNPKLSFGYKRSSTDSGNASCEYNSTKSLNVTDYVLDFLNSQEDEANPEVSQKTCSQESIVISSDEEVNYSNRFSFNTHNYRSSSDNNEDIDAMHAELTDKYKQKRIEPATNDITDSVVVGCKGGVDEVTPRKLQNTDIVTPKDNVMVKTDNVTPMADYDGMDTPKIREELDKFGIKPLKRHRGVQLLKYIYESTHPLVEIERPNKKRKLTEEFVRDDNKENIRVVGCALLENEKDELIFERKFSKKIPSCCVPLQIVWYNFLCCNPRLAENIVQYEPIQLETINSMLKEQSGCNFHIQDLTTFLDKKCITFRTNQWQNNRKK